MTAVLPTSRMGHFGVWASAAFLVLIVANAILQSVTEPPNYARLTLVWLTLAAAIIAAILALIAILRDKDRAILTFVALVPAAFALVFELIFE